MSWSISIFDGNKFKATVQIGAFKVSKIFNSSIMAMTWIDTQMGYNMRSVEEAMEVFGFFFLMFAIWLTFIFALIESQF